ncbi:sulfate/thiosulfate transporter subunit [Megasphaera cerevisiae DSM 20462]|jgi:sulfate transport system permease protein|uniref:Sulfate transport system permease protein CysT n=1 Tax=Megasphaera cerevisiae DSM 20462 TaxID=1122219 RepID=A0A0J6WRX4_9FIRM|nr:sulfate ABC transporter permease subunit CysT [Megasphaera cerevisiae]KMO86245.1 sulfate/thiosulfate transporter subunit [Megasphaera cerevisiae DSM 20462]OKY53062.1 sulfate ABC transporter permease subunit CysT [Megasphaera cerevisiae]SKA20688.1 sulfate transport system permease protein [Megasphaera cerevisiae DSM 20462]
MIKQLLKGNHVIPGFGLTMGISVTMLSCFVLIPLASVLVYSLHLPASEYVRMISNDGVRNAFMTSISCSFLAAVINCVFGTILAWVLVRYQFTGKRLLNGVIELPFALPTAVAGITLSKLYSDTGLIGSVFAQWGISLAYTKIGLTIALVFVGIPFVVRSIQPVLEKLDPAYEEAGNMLGAAKTAIFFRIILPELRPAILTGFGLAFARGLGEYGSVIYIAGNSAKNHTQVVSYVIMQKLNYVDYAGAASIALGLLVIAFVTLFTINMIQIHQARRAS